MPRNGSGTFNRLYSWEDDAANNIKIRADRMDAEMDGMATALTNSIAVDGQTPITANLPMSGFKHTGVADATEDDEYVAFGQANDLYQGFAPFVATDAGTDVFQFDAGRDVEDGDVITVTIPAANSTATPTGENTGGLPTGARDIVTSAGSAYIGMLQPRAHDLQWDNGNTRWIVLDPAPIDEDDMASDLADVSPSQQSVKAYADTKLAAPASSSDPALAFATWRTPNASRPTLVEVAVLCATDGTSNGFISAQVDESGGTTSDYSLGLIQADIDMHSSGTISMFNVSTILVPAGGSYRIVNNIDPTGTNSIEHIREFTL